MEVVRSSGRGMSLVSVDQEVWKEYLEPELCRLTRLSDPREEEVLQKVARPLGLALIRSTSAHKDGHAYS